jgi:hypothetical protein
MNRSMIEARALAILDRVAKKQPIEDDRVELKTVWLDPKDAARHLAAHANCMRGEPILWLIGVDERNSAVPGADQNELSNWHSKTAAQFCEGVLPDLAAHVNVPFGGGVVPVLYFLTDRAPYVVKNSAGGAISFEVPWRVGTSTRSATRTQLLRTLEPITRIPDAEILEANLSVVTPPGGSSLHDWHFSANLYLTPKARDQVVIPSHRSQAEVRIRRDDANPVLFSLRFTTGGGLLRSTDSEVILDGPGEAVVNGYHSSFYASQEVRGDERDRQVEIAITMLPIGAERPCRIATTLKHYGTSSPSTVAAWRLQRASQYGMPSEPSA